MPAPRLDLNTAPRTAVFRKLMQFVRTSATIKRVVKPTSIRDWSGLPQDAEPFNTQIAPCLRFTPICGPDAFAYPEAFAGDLLVNVEMLVEGTNVDDLFNLWYALARAIYPGGDQTFANVQALQQAGAKSGLADFTQPSFDPDPKDNFFYGTGQIRIAILSQLNT